MENDKKRTHKRISRKIFFFTIVLLLSLVFLVALDSVSADPENPDDWAIVLAGGVSTGSNHARYWNDIGEMYEILTETYCYDPDNVFVLYSDGNPPTADNCKDPEHVYATYDTGMIDYGASAANLSTVCSYIATNGNPDDTLFVFTSDHGGYDSSSNMSHLCLWHENLDADDFAGPSYIGQITDYQWRAFELEQCFSGGFVKYLSAPDTVIATACAWNESSIAMFPHPPWDYYDEFNYYFNAALKGEVPNGTAVDADVDDDGLVSFMEAYNFAWENDKFVEGYYDPTWGWFYENPQYDDNGDDISHTGLMPSGGDGALGATIFLPNACVVNTPPIADAGPDQTADEGDVVTFDGSGSSDPDGDPLTYSWDFGDGTTESGVAPTHIYCDNSDDPYIVTLTVTDDQGGSDTDTMTVTVSNLPPTADAGSDQTVDEGDTVYFSGSASDPGCDTLTYEWNYGDGSPPVTGTLTPSHIYCDNGMYTASLEVSDGDGGSGIDYLDVTVNNVAPTAIANVDQTTVDENTILNFDALASSDPGCDTLYYSWDFGEGTTSTEEAPQHTYGDNGVFEVVLTVTDDDGDSDTDTLTITVDNVAPQATNDLGFYWCDENTIRSLIVQNINDPGSDDITITWDFGDGTPLQTTIYYNNGVTPDPYPSPEINPVVSLMETTDHTYGDNGEFTVTVTLSDDDAGVSTVTGTVRVDNVNPIVDSLSLIIVDENTPIIFDGHATDPGSDDLTFTWNWGDGTPDTITTYFNDGVASDPYPSPEINPMDITDTVPHTYGDNGVFTVTLTVEDDDGGVTIQTTTVTVENVDPIVTPITLSLPYPDNPDFILPVHMLDFAATATDTGSDDLTFTWDFGDGTIIITTYFNDLIGPDLYPSPEVNPIEATDPVSHQYSGPGTYTITLTVTDDDGGVATTTMTVKVLTLEEAKHDINNYIQDLPDNVFKGKAEKRKNAFDNMFCALDDMLDDEEYWGMIQHLNNNIRTKCDGSQGGKPNDDWIKGNTPDGENAQLHICSKIDDLTAYIVTYL